MTRVRDIRRLLGEASFLLIDLSSANINVRRELRLALDSALNPVCYAHDAAAEGKMSTVGILHPAIALDGERVNQKVWSRSVYLANYEDPARRVFKSGPAGELHEILAADLGHTWERPAAELALFKFASEIRSTHFRAIFSWLDV